MKTIFAFTLLLFVTGFIYPESQIKIDSIETNVGVFPSGQSITGEFSLKNSGKTPLAVSIQTDRDCVLKHPAEFTLPSGQNVNVLYEVQTKSSYDGDINKHIVIRSNDKDKPFIYFVIKGIATNPKLDPHKEFSHIINYTTTLDMNTLKSNNILTIFNYKHCKGCIGYINNTIRHELKKGNPISVQYYNLELNVNKYNLDKLINTLGYFPELPIIVISGKFYCGKKAITAYLQGDSKDDLTSRPMNKELNTLVIFTAGLLDGINPCAFTVILLLVSYLSLQLRSARSILLSGIIYIATVFVTYFLVGLGLFQVIKTLSLFPTISLIIKITLIAALFILALLSFVDFIKARQGKHKEMILKLPDAIQNSIRKNIRFQMKDYSIVLSSLILGFTVSVFELICTGQVYLPVIGYMTQNAGEQMAGIFYLTLYNIAFIIPLSLVFVLVFFGFSSQKIGKVFAQNIALVKLLFVFLFIGFGIITLLTTF